MNIDQKFIEAFKKDWYIQGFNAYPLFLNRAGISGFEMEKVLGFGYSLMLYYYEQVPSSGSKNGYCEMHYLNDDLKRIWQKVKENLKKDPHYVEKIAVIYFEIFKKHEKLFKRIDTFNLSNLNESQLLKLFKKCSQALIDAVGVAHLVDPIGIGSEHEFKQKLLGEVKDKSKFNEYYSILTTPSKLSFLGQEEKELRKAVSLENHLKKYFWVNNSYAGQAQITIRSLERRLSVLVREQKRKSKISKNKLLKNLNLSKSLKEMINLIDFTTIWQDRRKKNILISVAYFSKVLEEISRRVEIQVKLLYFLGIKDFNKINSLADFKRAKNELEKRSRGVFFLHDHGQEFVASGRKYQVLLQPYQKNAKTNFKFTEDIHGSVANRGTAIGRVIICKDLESIQKVKKGDVIVASMTRPEFMPALKIASAIVTDEGGVTCHAAILSRELGIPAVIGTKIATKVLRDGMNVEVRANHGLIRIIG